MAKRISLLLITVLCLSGCDYSKSDNRTGLFYNTFVQPMDRLLHLFGRLFNDNYGLAIIAIVLIVRFILLPFMFIQVKNMHIMREKRKSFNHKLIKLERRLKKQILKRNETQQINY